MMLDIMMFADRGVQMVSDRGGNEFQYDISIIVFFFNSIFFSTRAFHSRCFSDGVYFYGHGILLNTESSGVSVYTRSLVISSVDR